MGVKLLNCKKIQNTNLKVMECKKNKTQNKY